MKTILLTILTLFGFTSIAMAADKITDVKSESFAVEKMICDKSYVPATGRDSPTYQAGVDVNGNAVAPADINPITNNNRVPDYVEVPMTVDLAERMGLTQVGVDAKLPVANLKLYKNGKVEYNGQDISSNAATMCGVAQKSDVSSSIKTIEPAAGQDQMIAAPSETVQPDTSHQYQVDSVAPQDFEPQAGSVAASSTSEPPKMEVQLQRGTVNRATMPVTLAK